ncbi:MAG TPA: proton-conducting transporter membrane subunit [bacterium]|nr:proton-conducting transporter membrane subunit [bacterium]HPS29205.1 proton-conducting transporter membrane subunit [bacterium]
MTLLLILAILPVVTALICLILKSWKVQYALTLSSSLIHLAVSFGIFIGYFTPGTTFMFGFDALSKLFLLVLSNTYFWIVLVSYSYIKLPVESDSTSGKKYYFMLMNFYLVANTAAVLSNHFGMYWVAVEMTTLSVAPLVYYSRSEESLVAMWKYLFIVSVGIAFAFIGILFLALSAKGTILDGEQLYFAEYMKNAATLSPIWLKASFIFIFVGLSTKIGIAPMHSGDIDATSSAPSPIAALFSGTLRITALLGVLRMFQIIRPTGSFEFAKGLLIIGGLFSIFVAFIYMFRVTDYKKMVAYSSVEHLGIIALGIGTGGIAFIGALYHIVFNSMTKVGLFLCAGKIHLKYNSRNVSDIFSVLNRLPWTGWIFFISFFAVSGIPPFGFFFSEIRIFEGVFFSDRPYLLIIAMIFLLFIFINMGHTVFKMLYKRGKNEKVSIESEKFDIFHFASISILIVMVLIAVFNPAVLADNITSIANDFGILP